MRLFAGHLEDRKLYERNMSLLEKVVDETSEELMVLSGEKALDKARVEACARVLRAASRLGTQHCAAAVQACERYSEALLERVDDHFLSAATHCNELQFAMLSIELGQIAIVIELEGNAALSRRNQKLIGLVDNRCLQLRADICSSMGRLREGALVADEYRQQVLWLNAAKAAETHMDVFIPQTCAEIRAALGIALLKVGMLMPQV